MVSRERGSTSMMTDYRIDWSESVWVVCEAVCLLLFVDVYHTESPV
jgi:hypothetical protein